MDYFEEGFCVREPSWHRKETLVMRDLVLPDDREEAVQLAGHDFTVVGVPNGNVLEPIPSPLEVETDQDVVRVGGQWYLFDHREEKKGLYIDQPRGEINGVKFYGPVHGKHLEVVNDSLTTIQNSVGWDLLEAIVGQGAKLDTGLTLKGGAVCVVTAYLDEPVTLPGDDSVTLPFLVVRWAHDGSGALATRSTSVRVVCANTDEAAAFESAKYGTDFTFRHTRNVMQQIEDAKLAIRGLRESFEEYTELARELAGITVTAEQKELFVTTMLPMPPEALISDRVVKNVETAREAVRTIMASRTIPEAHKDTALGLRYAGVEYLDHLRGFRNRDTYVGRQLLRTEPAKVKLAALIQEVVKS